jgi:hypothetical protein
LYSSKKANKNLEIQKNTTLLVQLVERRFPKPDVVGSSPTGRDEKPHHFLYCCLRIKQVFNFFGEMNRRIALKEALLFECFNMEF